MKGLYRQNTKFLNVEAAATYKLVQVKAIRVQSWTGPEGSKRFRLTRFHDNRHMNVANCQP